MIREVADRDVMQGYVAAVRRQLEAGTVDDVAAKAAAAARPGAEAKPADEILENMPAAGAGDASTALEDGPFLARDPIVSLLQTSIEAKLHEDGLVDQRPREGHGHGFLVHLRQEAERLLHPERFGPDDLSWGNHPFNRQPAEYELEGDARVVVVGDWGTGLDRARDVATHMADEVREAVAEGGGAHVVRLGDVYYSGDPEDTIATSSPTGGGR